MKREDLKAMGLDDAAIDKIMAENGKDIEKAKADLKTAETTAEQLKTQLTEANKTIEGFKAMDVEGVKKTADEYKAKFEQGEKDHAAELAKIARGSAAERFIDGLQPKDALSKKAILAEFHAKDFKLEGDTFQGAKEWADQFKKDNAAHFTAATPLKSGDRHGSSGTTDEGKTVDDEIAASLFGKAGE